MKRVLVFLTGLSLLLLTGCLVSATFTFTDTFKLSVSDGYSHEYVDVTDDSDWEDARDNLDRIESVAFEIFFDNPSASPTVFNVYIDDPPESNLLTSVAEVQTDATLVLEKFTIPAGKSKMTYSQSFKFLTPEGATELKRLAKGGAFHVYGIGPELTSFTIDSGVVIITLNASDGG